MSVRSIIMLVNYSLHIIYADEQTKANKPNHFSLQKLLLDQYNFEYISGES